MCPTVESPSFMKCIKCVSQLHKVSSPVYLTCSPFTQRQADVSSVVIQLCRFDLAAVSRPTLHRPPRLSSPSSRISVQRESCLHTITQVIILCLCLACKIFIMLIMNYRCFCSSLPGFIWRLALTLLIDPCIFAYIYIFLHNNQHKWQVVDLLC